MGDFARALIRQSCNEYVRTPIFLAPSVSVSVCGYRLKRVFCPQKHSGQVGAGGRGGSAGRLVGLLSREGLRPWRGGGGLLLRGMTGSSR